MKLLKGILSILLLLSILKGALPLALLLGNVSLSSDNQLVIESSDEHSQWEHFLAELSEKAAEQEEKKEEKKESNDGRETVFEPHSCNSSLSNTLIQSLFARCEAVQWHCAHLRYANIHSEQARLTYLSTHHIKVRC